MFWRLEHKAWATDLPSRRGQSQRSSPLTHQAYSLPGSGGQPCSSTCHYSPQPPQRVSWLVGWPTGVVCAEFLPKEGEAMLATPYITLSTCQGGEILLWKKQLLHIPLYLGLNKSQKQWDLVKKSVANHANGSSVVWNIRAGECVIEC